MSVTEGMVQPADLVGDHEQALAATPSALRRFLHQPKGLIPGVVLVLIVIAVFLGPLVWTQSPTAIDLGDAMAGPSASHPLGTDENGRDVLARLLAGGQVSLLVGLGTMLVIVTIGVAIGAAGGFLGGRVDAVVVQVIDGMMAVPQFFLWLICLTVLRPSVMTIVLVLGLTSWTSTARVVRGEVLRARSLEFVDAARAIGASRARLLWRHCMPQAASATIVAATLAVAFAILMESALSFVGVGIQPPTAGWGNMLSGAQQYIFTRPALAIYPGVAIAVTVLCLNLIGDSLRDIFDPRHDQ